MSGHLAQVGPCLPHPPGSILVLSRSLSQPAKSYSLNLGLSAAKAQSLSDIDLLVVKFRNSHEQEEGQWSHDALCPWLDDSSAERACRQPGDCEGEGEAESRSQLGTSVRRRARALKSAFLRVEAHLRLFS